MFLGLSEPSAKHERASEIMLNCAFAFGAALRTGGEAAATAARLCSFPAPECLVDPLQCLAFPQEVKRNSGILLSPPDSASKLLCPRGGIDQLLLDNLFKLVEPRRTEVTSRLESRRLQHS